MSGQPVCPECNTVVENHWEWCHNCGFDPDRKRPAGAALLSSTTPLGGANPGLLDAPTPASSFDAPAPYEPPAPFDSVASFEEPAPFDPGALFATPAPPADAPVTPPPTFEPASYAAAPYEATTFDPFNAPSPGSFAGTPEPVSAGGAFDALQSLSGPPAAVDGWDSAPPTLAPPPPAPYPGLPTAPGGAAPKGLPRRDPQLPRPGMTPPSRLPRLLAVAGGVAVAGVVLVGVLAGASSVLGSNTRSLATTTTLDPSAPPPIGQLPLGGRSPDTELGAAPEPELYPGWETYRAPDGTFTVNFPAAPAVASVTWPDGTRVAEVATAAGGGLFSVQYADGIRRGEWDMSRLGWHPTGTFEVASGMEGTAFANDAGVPEARGFVLLQGGRLYVVGAFGASDSDFHAFIHGFRWLKNPD